MSAAKEQATTAAHTRRLFQPFAFMLGLSVLLQVASLVGVLKLGSVRERSRSTVAVAENLGGLVEQYQTATYLALVGLSVSDWELLIRERNKAKELTARFEQAIRVLRQGGQAAPDAAEVMLSGSSTPEINRALTEAERSWREMATAHLRILRSDSRALKGNPALDQFQSVSLEASRRSSAIEEALRTHADAEMRWLVALERAIPLGAFMLTVLLGVFVFSRLIVPLGASMERLEKSEGELRLARDDLEQRVIERTAELRQADEELRQRTEVLDSILNNMGDAVVAADTERRLILFNTAAHALFSVEEQDARVARLWQINEFFLPDGVTPFPVQDAPLARALRGEASDQVEMFIRRREHPDGIWLSVNARPLYGPDRRLRGAVVVSRDVSLRKQAEQALRRINEELELRVRERTRELKEAQGRAIDLARQAGMMEVATNMLHNVGNVLNSVNTSAAMLNEQLRASRLPTLGKAAAMLNDHRADLAAFLTRDERGRQLPDYMGKLSKHLLAERDEMLAMTEVLSRHVEHIRTIVNLQQSYAKATVLLEPVSLRELVEDALRISAAALRRHDVAIERHVAELAPVLVNKHKLLQILLNLISNAKYALDERPAHERRVILRLERLGEDRLRLQVSDSGMGIAPEVLPRIFQHGFTTRAQGHGFGLHSCALAASAMGGSLEAHSDGPERGATFTLEFPYRAG